MRMILLRVTLTLGFSPTKPEANCFTTVNNVDTEIKELEQIGSQYYTLTYQPESVDPDGKFRRVRVSLRNPNFHAVTKAGYYAPDAHAPIDERHQQMIKLAEAVQSTIPFKSLDLMLSGIVRHPDARAAGFTVELSSKNLIFEPSEGGKQWYRHHGCDLVSRRSNAPITGSRERNTFY